ncbi:hypothetical protein [Nocardia sp. NPDC005745]
MHQALPEREFGVRELADQCFGAGAQPRVVRVGECGCRPLVFEG